MAVKDPEEMTDEELLAYFKEKNRVAQNPVSMVAAAIAREEIVKRGLTIEQHK